MRTDELSLGLILASQLTAATQAHGGSHHQHHHAAMVVRQNNNQQYQPYGHQHGASDKPTAAAGTTVDKRETAATCSLPEDQGLVVVPGAENGGWALSPDQKCSAGSWCPYACPPGQVMAQWKPGTGYHYPESMYGGIWCDENARIKKPFPDKPYCVDGAGTVSVRNEAGSALSFCQTVLPGNEAMLIPTVIENESVIAVPDTSYWAQTASHFYVNPPGITDEGCIWGTSSKAIGNWSPYVAGANVDTNGNTFLKIGWNPEFLTSPAIAKTQPDFALEIECAPGSTCNGLPCSIYPKRDGINGIHAPSSGEITPTGTFCVATVGKGGHATIVVKNADGSSSSGSSSGSGVRPGAGPNFIPGGRAGEKGLQLAAFQKSPLAQSQSDGAAAHDQQHQEQSPAIEAQVSTANEKTATLTLNHMAQEKAPASSLPAASTPMLANPETITAAAPALPLQPSPIPSSNSPAFNADSTDSSASPTVPELSRAANPAVRTSLAPSTAASFAKLNLTMAVNVTSVNTTETNTTRANAVENTTLPTNDSAPAFTGHSNPAVKSASSFTQRLSRDWTAVVVALVVMAVMLKVEL